MVAETNPFDAYDARIATSDLRRNHEKGPNKWTRMLVEALKAEGVEGATLLDIGGGIGVIQQDLLAAGVSHVTSVDASAAYLDVARAESERQGYGARVTFLHGDFVQLAESVPAADIVTLERVLNVYPGWERLAGLSAAHARRLYGLVYPRDRLLVRLVIAFINLRLRSSGKLLRAAVVPADALERVARENGLTPHFCANVGAAWQVALYRRT